MASVFSTAGVALSTANVIEGGSIYWFVHKIADTTGAALGTPDDWNAGGARVAWTLTPSTSKREVTLENRQKVTVGNEISYELSIKVGQRDDGTLYGFQSVAFVSGGSPLLQFLLEVVSSGVLDGTKRQYMTCMGRMTTPNSLGDSGDIEYKFDVAAATGSISINLATGYTGSTVFPGFSAATGTVAQASGQFYGLSDV